MSVFVDTLVAPVIEGIEENCTSDEEKADVIDRVITSLKYQLAEWEPASPEPLGRHYGIVLNASLGSTVMTADCATKALARMACNDYIAGRSGFQSIVIPKETA